jgi:hypothetical protein
MNNLLSYCGLIDTRIRAPDKDLPVIHYKLPGQEISEAIFLGLNSPKKTTIFFSNFCPSL